MWLSSEQVEGEQQQATSSISAEKQELESALKHYSSVCRLAYAIHMTAMRIVRGQRGINANHFFVDFERISKKALPVREFEEWCSLKPEGFELAPIETRVLLGRAYKAYRLGPHGVYRSLYQQIENQV